jgi:hypothetical protein
VLGYEVAIGAAQAHIFSIIELDFDIAGDESVSIYPVKVFMDISANVLSIKIVVSDGQQVEF